ncbi:MAG: hypothetical protein K2Q18_13070 [Bdellovibrionales bacterium]|nr:hypothetical protein [Bdellovibrionales bacterium]
MKMLSLLTLLLSFNTFAKDYTFQCKSVRDSSFYYGMTGEVTITYSSNEDTGIYDAFLNAKKKNQPNPIKSMVLNYTKRNNSTPFIVQFSPNGLKDSVQSSSGILSYSGGWAKPVFSISQFVVVMPDGKVGEPNSNLYISEVIPAEAQLITFEIHQCVDNGLKKVPQSLIDAGKTQDNTQIGYEF